MNIPVEPEVDSTNDAIADDEAAAGDLLTISIFLRQNIKLLVFRYG